MRNLKQLLYFQHGKEIYSLNLKNGGNLRREVETIKRELNRNSRTKNTIAEIKTSLNGFNNISKCLNKTIF